MIQEKTIYFLTISFSFFFSLWKEVGALEHDEHDLNFMMRQKSNKWMNSATDLSWKTLPCRLSQIYLQQGKNSSHFLSLCICLSEIETFPTKIKNFSAIVHCCDLYYMKIKKYRKIKKKKNLNKACQFVHFPALHPPPPKNTHSIVYTLWLQSSFNFFIYTGKIFIYTGKPLYSSRDFTVIQYL